MTVHRTTAALLGYRSGAVIYNRSRSLFSNPLKTGARNGRAAQSRTSVKVLFIRRDNAASLRAHEKMGMREVAGFAHGGAEMAVLAYIG